RLHQVHAAEAGQCADQERVDQWPQERQLHGGHGAHQRARLGDLAVLHQREGQRLPQLRRRFQPRLRGLRQGRRRQGHRGQDQEGRDRQFRPAPERAARGGGDREGRARLKRTLFISDLHLDESRPGIVEAFERFLRGPARDAEAIYILGDLFEYWLGDDGLAHPFAARIARDLAAVAKDKPVYFMHGNRAFLVAEGFARATGVRLLEDPAPLDLYGTPAL